MFAILVPAALAPLIVTLLWAERKAKKLGLINTNDNPDQHVPVTTRVLDTIGKLDIFGLLLLGISVALILLPLTLTQGAKGHWKNGEYHVFVDLLGV